MQALGVHEANGILAVRVNDRVLLHGKVDVAMQNLHEDFVESLARTKGRPEFGSCFIRLISLVVIRIFRVLGCLCLRLPDRMRI